MDGKCKCDRETKLGHEWRGVVLSKPLCAVCANDAVKSMIKNKEVQDLTASLKD